MVSAEHNDVIESLTEDRISYKEDIFQPEWLLTKDDILSIAIIADASIITNGFKLSKSKIMMVYEVCHKHGIFPKIEFKKTEYGLYFKEFYIKLNCLLNHGLLIDADRFSDKRTDFRIGPLFNIFERVAGGFLAENKVLIRTVADDLKTHDVARRKKAYELRQQNQGN